MTLPTLDSFLKQEYPNNSYLQHKGFKSLYVRKGQIAVTFNANARLAETKFYICRDVITIAAVTASKPGQGTFTKLIQDLVGKGLAIYVENVHNPRLAKKLETMGFIQVNHSFGVPHYLYNHDGHLAEYGN